MLHRLFVNTVADYTPGRRFNKESGWRDGRYSVRFVRTLHPAKINRYQHIRVRFTITYTQSIQIITNMQQTRNLFSTSNIALSCSDISDKFMTECIGACVRGGWVSGWVGGWARLYIIAFNNIRKDICTRSLS